MTTRLLQLAVILPSPDRSVRYDTIRYGIFSLYPALSALPRFINCLYHCYLYHFTPNMITVILSTISKLPKCQLSRLQQIQISLGRTVVKAFEYCHISPILRSLHWLRITERIEYKLISLTYKVLTTT